MAASLCSHLNRGRLEESVAEHLDHLHYIGDILSLGVESLNTVIVDHLLNRLLIRLCYRPLPLSGLIYWTIKGTVLTTRYRPPPSLWSDILQSYTSL